MYLMEASQWILTRKQGNEHTHTRPPRPRIDTYTCLLNTSWSPSFHWAVPEKLLEMPKLPINQAIYSFPLSSPALLFVCLHLYMFVIYSPLGEVIAHCVDKCELRAQSSINVLHHYPSRCMSDFKRITAQGPHWAKENKHNLPHYGMDYTVQRWENFFVHGCENDAGKLRQEW